MPAGIDLENAPGDIRRERFVGWLGYAVLGIFVPLAALGVFGGGYFWQRTVDSGQASLSYPRVCRMYRDVELRLKLPPREPVVSVPSSLLESFEVINMAPDTASQWSSGDRVVMRFQGDTQQNEMAVRMRLQADKPGLVSADVEVPGEGMLPLRILVLP